MFARVQLGLVDAGDLIGDAQHGGPPRKDFIAQKGVTAIAPLARVPGEYRREDIPVVPQGLIQVAERRRLRFVQQSLVSRERGFHPVSRSEQARAMRLGHRGVRFKKAIADVGARQVKV